MPTNEIKKSVTRLKEKLYLQFATAKYIEQYQRLAIYWEIGYFINQEKKQNYEQLASELKDEFAELQDLSSLDLRHMREFSKAYPEFLNLQLSLVKETDHRLKLVPFVPWSCQVVILGKVKSLNKRLFYLEKTLEQGWNKNMLSKQITGKFYENQKK